MQQMKWFRRFSIRTLLTLLVIGVGTVMLIGSGGGDGDDGPGDLSQGVNYKEITGLMGDNLFGVTTFMTELSVGLLSIITNDEIIWVDDQPISIPGACDSGILAVTLRDNGAPFGEPSADDSVLIEFDDCSISDNGDSETRNGDIDIDINDLDRESYTGDLVFDFLGLVLTETDNGDESVTSIDGCVAAGLTIPEGQGVYELALTTDITTDNGSCTLDLVEDGELVTINLVDLIGSITVPGDWPPTDGSDPLVGLSVSLSDGDDFNDNVALIKTLSEAGSDVSYTMEIDIPLVFDYGAQSIAGVFTIKNDPDDPTYCISATINGDGVMDPTVTIRFDNRCDGSIDASETVDWNVIFDF